MLVSLRVWLRGKVASNASFFSGKEAATRCWLGGTSPRGLVSRPASAPAPCGPAPLVMSSPQVLESRSATAARSSRGDVEFLDGLQKSLHVEVFVEQRFVDELQRIVGWGRSTSHDSSSVMFGRRPRRSCARCFAGCVASCSGLRSAVRSAVSRAFGASASAPRLHLNILPYPIDMPTPFNGVWHSRVESAKNINTAREESRRRTAAAHRSRRPG